MAQQDQGSLLVGIQVGRRQEEEKNEETKQIEDRTNKKDQN